MLTGVNIPEVGTRSRLFVFADVMRQRGAWGTYANPGDAACPLDANGDPTADCGVYIVEGDDRNSAAVPAGDYLLTIPGTADVSAHASNVQIVGTIVSPTGPFTTAFVRVGTDSLNLALKFANCKRQDGSPGLKGVTLLSPGHTVADTYDRNLVATLSNFAQARFMDATRTNGHPVWKWNQRTTEGGWQGWVTGMAWEHVFGLCNAAGVDPWINVPHMADYEYVTELAKLAVAKLDKKLRLYVEYSNEVWNPQFQQYGWNGQQASIEGADGSYEYPGDVNPKNPAFWSFRRVASKTVEISQAFAAAFGGADRVRPILGHQIGWDGQLADMCRWLVSKNLTPSKYVWGAAVGSYLGHADSVKGRQGLTADQIVQSHRSTIAGVDAAHQHVRAEAATYGLKSGAYEFGTEDEDPWSIDAKVAAQAMPEMGMVVYDYATECAKGLDFGNWFLLASAYSQAGCWGLSDQFLSTTPKLKAYLDFTKGQRGQPAPAPPPPVSPLIVPPPAGAASGVDSVTFKINTDGSVPIGITYKDGSTRTATL